MKAGIAVLRDLPLLASCAPGALEALNEASDLARFGPDEPLFAAGDQLNDLMFLTAGHVGLTTPHGREGRMLADVLLPVQPLCLPAVLLGLPAPVGAQTLSSCRLVLLPVSVVRELVESDAAVGRSFLHHALKDSDGLARTVYDLKLRSSPQRLASYLLDLIEDRKESPARFVLPMEKRLIAAAIGCSQENLSRAFAALRAVGVDTQRGVVVVRDIAALQSFAFATGNVTKLYNH